jgi:hypothetical protein
VATTSKKKSKTKKEEEAVIPSPSSAPAVKLTKPETAAVSSVPSIAVAAAAGDDSLSGLTVKDLKELCRQRGKPVSGTKAELISRLATTTSS